MQSVPQIYQMEMKKQLRGRTYMRVEFGMVDVTAADDIQEYRDNGQHFLSDLEETPRRTQTLAYATGETGGFFLDGSQRVAPQSEEEAKIEYQGFISESVSDPDGGGYFEESPFVEYRFYKTHSTKGLTLIFDPVMKRYPKQIGVRISRGSKDIVNRILSVDSHRFTIGQTLEDFDRLRITFLQYEGEQRARLSQIIFGVGLLFDNSLLVNATQTRDVDPITRRLPTNTLDFTILDQDRMYDPEDPEKNYYHYIDKKSPMTVFFGQQVRDWKIWQTLLGSRWESKPQSTWGQVKGDYIEWMRGGGYVLNAKPTVSETSISFKGMGLLEGLESTCVDAAYNPAGPARTFFELATLVCRQAGLLDSQYSLSTTLKDVKTTAPLPEAAHRDCLKMLAQAAQCILFTDLDGVIHVEPCGTKNTGFGLTFDDMLEYPKFEKSPPLQSIEGKYYSYAWDEKGEIKKTENKVIFDASTEGFRHFEEVGEMEKIENPLITTPGHLKSVALWVANYLRLRNTYVFDYRGNPELESNDRITIQSNFAKDVPAVILKHVIQFDGGLKGRAIVKKLEE